MAWPLVGSLSNIEGGGPVGLCLSLQQPNASSDTLAGYRSPAWWGTATDEITLSIHSALSFAPHLAMSSRTSWGRHSMCSGFDPSCWLVQLWPGLIGKPQVAQVMSSIWGSLAAG